MIPENNGDKVYTLLVEYNTRTGLPTGRVRPNVPSDPFYIAPVQDFDTCPLPEPVEPTYYGVNVMVDNFEVVVKLLYGSNYISVDRTTTWTIVDRSYDSIIFEVTYAPNPYVVIIKYSNGSEQKQVVTSGVKNIFIQGSFIDITDIIVQGEGDYNSDWNSDYQI